MDNLEFGSTCCIILALHWLLCGPGSFLFPVPTSPSSQWIWCLPSRFWCCWVGELKPSNSVNRKQEMEETALRRVEFQSFSSPKILSCAVVCVPGVLSFQGIIPGAECCWPAPKAPPVPVESSAPAPVLSWWHWDGNWEISIPSILRVFGMSCGCEGRNPNSQSMSRACPQKHFLCLHHIDWKAGFFGCLSRKVCAFLW